jgi:signal transduction histidine kinase
MFRHFKNIAIKNGRVIVLVLATILIATSLLLSYDMAETLKQKEKYDMELWATAVTQITNDTDGNQIKDYVASQFINSRNNIPFIVVDKNGTVTSYHRVPSRIIYSPTLLAQELDEMQSENDPIVISFKDQPDKSLTIYYGHSFTLQALYIFPIVQLLIIVIFVLCVFIVFRSLKQGEQSRVWAGLAKETAHQLGTPTSSLLGWIEHLREQPVDQSVVDEMEKDVYRLMKIGDRFSKIGSDTPLKEESLNEVVGEAVGYFRKRIPRNVTLELNGFEGENVVAKTNVSLFEWVVENLMKNALDATQGRGTIAISLGQDSKYAWVEVADTGKGIPKSEWKHIFEPGYTTKTRGWGLGLSLSRRIIEEYHKGKIAVVYSEIDKGTIFRITLKKGK